MEPLTIRIENLKAIRSLDWSPSGVCVLVGPNGSGKSTALRALLMLHTALERGYDEGLRLFGGGPIRNLDAKADRLPEIAVRYGQTEWKLTLSLSMSSDPPERAERNGRSLFERARPPYGTLLVGSGSHVGATMPMEANHLILEHVKELHDAELHALKRVLLAARYYSRPDLAFLRNEGSSSSIDTQLDVSAKNLFSVLRNWRDKSEHDYRWQFVTQWMSECFSDFRRLDFANWGPRVGAELPRAGKSEKLQPSDWSDGFMTVLCHLTAVASIDDGGVVGVDEVENSLHPELVAKLVEAMREWSTQHEVTVLLATHSPVVLDQFKDEPEQVFVMQPGHEKLPVALTDLKKRDWLKHFSLGDLYSHLEVGAPEQ